MKKIISYGKIIAFIVVINLLLQLLYNELRFSDMWPYDTLSSALHDLILNLLPLIAMATLNFLFIFTFWSKIKWVPSHLTKLLIEIVFSFLVLALIDFLFLAIGRIFNPDLDVDFPGTMLYNVVIILIIESSYYIEIAHESIQRESETQKTLLSYHYNLLHIQVNPHFLFNSLNILVALIKMDPDKAVKYTICLSRIYQYILSVRDKRCTNVTDELDFTRKYVSILEIRYNNNLKVNFSLCEDLKNKYVLPLIFQVLIENAVKHNEISEVHPMQIDIVLGENDFTVSNNICPKHTVESTGFGSQYISECYSHMGGSYEVNTEGDKYSVKLSYL